MKLLKYMSNQFASLYCLYRNYIHSILGKYNPTEKQIDDLANKLDILGGAIIAQSMLFPFGSNLLSNILIVLSILFCGIIWMTTFIMKGYKNAGR